MTDEAPDLDELTDAFPPVERETLDRVASMLDERGDPIRFETVADVLANAADMGKVPDREYMAMAASAAGYEPMDLDVSDPLDEPPDADPGSPRNAQRAEQAMATIRKEQFPRRAERAKKEGTIPEMIELLEVVNKWANEALLAPDRKSVPSDCKDASETLADAIVARIDALAAQDERERLEETQTAARSMSTDAFQSAIIDEVDQKLRLLNNTGEGYRDARERVLDEDNTPAEARRMYQDALENSDITYEQAVELGEDVKDWLQEYQQAVEQAGQ